MTERMLVSMRANAVSLEQELDWFSRVLESGFRLYFGQACDHSSIRDIARLRWQARSPSMHGWLRC